MHYRNAYQLMPKTLGNEPVRYIMLDDASDPTNAAKNARKLVAEDKVDVLMGSNGVPSAVQMAQVAAEAKVPMIVLTPGGALAAGAALVVHRAAVHRAHDGRHRPAAEGARASRRSATSAIPTPGATSSTRRSKSHAAASGYKVVTNERYARADTSVTGQILRIMSANPDAVVVGGSGTGGALPHVALVERGYKKGIYHNHGTVNAEFIKVGGKAVDGAVAVTGPLVVPEELPDGHPTKKVSLEFTKRYESTFGAGTRNAFAGYAYDGMLILNAAVPEALKKAKPGTRGVPRGAARRARERAQRGRHARRLQHGPEEPQRPGRARPRGGARRRTVPGTS